MRRLAIALALLSLAGLGWWWRADRGSEPRERARLQATEAEPASLELTDAEPIEDGAPALAERESVHAPASAELGLVLAGRVLEKAAGASSGVPAVGVVVQLARNEPRGLEQLGQLGYGGGGRETPVGPLTRTDGDGAFRFVLPDDGARPHSLHLRVEGDERFREAGLRFQLDAGETRRVGLELVRRAFGSLEGIVFDLAARPVAEAQVVVLDWDEASQQPMPRVTARTDENGRFTLERVEAVSVVEARKPGYTLLEGKRPTLAEDGTWSRMDLVLAASGELRVRVTDRSGDPLAHIGVTLQIAAAERVAHRGWNDSLRTVRQTETDTEGVAHLLDVWAGQRLRVALQRSAADGAAALASFERVDGTQALLEEDGGGVPLVLSAAESRDLRVELAVRLRIYGQVLDASRSPYAGPFLTLRALDRPANEPGALRLEARGDAKGRFELELLAPRPLGQVLLEAGDIALYDISPSRAAELGAAIVLDLTGRTGGEQEVTLVLQARRAIVGRLLADPPVIARVRAMPTSSEVPFGMAPSGALRYVHSAKGGEFRLLGLPPGRYDLEIVPSTTFPIHWLRGVEAGTEGLLVPLTGSKPARVTVEVALEGGELGETILLSGRLRPHGAASSASVPPVAELAHEASLRALEGWPPTMLGFGPGGGGRTDAQGYTSFSLTALPANPTTIELDAGLQWIGVRARAQDGNPTLPIGTGLVRVEAGEYHLRFELTPSASLSGRVRGEFGGRELCVALAQGGKLLWLDVRQDELRPLCELGADGTFAFPLAPAGALELRVGTRAELLAGRWSQRQELTLARGETREMVIEL